MRSVKVAVIGAGSAGLYAVSEIKKQTEDFVLINDGPYGTTCARVGCMPSKALLHFAGMVHGSKNFFDSPGGFSREEVLKQVRSYRDMFVKANIEGGVKALGERVIDAKVRFIDEKTLRAGRETIRAERIVIATGSTPVMHQEWSELGERVLTSDRFFEQRTLPEKAAVLGGGAIGLELGQAMARLGTEVTLIHSKNALGGIEDERVNEALVKRLEKEMLLWRGEHARLKKHEKGVAVSAGEKSVVVDGVVAAIGRKPNLEGLGLEEIGVPLDRRGIPRYDCQTMRIEGTNIYLAGDVNADVPLLHEAGDEGRIAGYNAAGTPRTFVRKHPFAIVFCEPGIALIGQRASQIKEPFVTVHYDFSKQGRAIMTEKAYGVSCLHVRKSDGGVLGAELVGPGAEHLGHLLAWSMEQRLTIYRLLEFPFYHPTYEEGLQELLLAAVKKLEINKDGILTVRG